MNTNPITLLIVDDDPVFARYLQELIRVVSREVPCTQQWVDSAEKALDVLQKKPFDLALLDYNLPGADGLALLANIQAIPASTHPAVIMLTASGSEAVAVEAMKRGARDYLPKGGLDVSLLLRAMKNALSQKRLAEQVAAYDAQMKADLEMAQHLQQSMLPDSYPRIPSSAAPEDSILQFCHRYIPARNLAGDFFSLFALSDTRAGVFICDVVGHGVRAALITAMLRALVENLAPQRLQPGEFLGEMNRKLSLLLRQKDDTTLYATGFYLVADVGLGRMFCANAAHPPPIHLHRSSSQATRLSAPKTIGPALGLFPSSDYTTSEFPLEPSDLVLLFTDGLFEVVDANGEQDYSQERLLDAARAGIRLPAPSLCDELIAGVRAFSGGAEFEDDVCLVGMDVKP